MEYLVALCDLVAGEVAQVIEISYKTQLETKKEEDDLPVKVFPVKMQFISSSLRTLDWLC